MNVFYKISFAQLTEFVGASEARKKGIIREQKKPNPFAVPRYRVAKTAIPGFFVNDFDKEVIVEAIERLKNSDQSSEWKQNNVRNSILALRRFLDIQFPVFFHKIKCSFITKFSTRSILLRNVNVNIKPDLVFRWEKDGVNYVGGITFHISKTKPLDSFSGRLRASFLAHFLKETQVESDERVESKHCYCIDVIHERVFYAPDDISSDIAILKDACIEIMNLWNAA